jgi:hypothetical protein
MPEFPGEKLPQDAGQESTWSNPAKISRKVRELAYQSHKAFKTAAQPQVPAPKESEDGPVDPGDLRSQLARLQQKIHARRLGALIPWIDALRQRVEDRLSRPEKTDVQ